MRGTRRPSFVKILVVAILLTLPIGLAHAAQQFKRGDSTGDGQFDLSDPIATLGFLFLGGSEPPCKDAADADGDGSINLTDAIFSLTYLFQGGSEPPAPGPKACGLPDASRLGCNSYPPCPSGTNQQPVITVPAGTSTDVPLVAEQVTLSVTATDGDNDPLTYTWSQVDPASPAGTFTDGNTAGAKWASPPVGADTTFKLRVSVTDGKSDPVTSDVSLTVSASKLSGDIQPIISVHCSCHTKANPDGGVTLTKGNVVASLVNVAVVRAECSPGIRVVPGNLDNSVLIKFMTGATCGQRMPGDDQTLFDRKPEFLARFESWILAGAKDDQAVNSPPVITVPAGASTDAPAVAEQVTLSVTATDADSDTLTYSWTQVDPLDLVGTFTDAGTAGAKWASPAVPADTVFKLRVSVTDGKSDPVTSDVSVTVAASTLSGDLQPIINVHCSCHTKATPDGNVSLTKANVFASLVNAAVVRTECSPGIRVVPGNLDNSVLVKFMTGATCGQRMPGDDQTLFDRKPEFLLRFESWILAGAQNN